MWVQFQGDVLYAHLDGDVLVADGRELDPDAGTVELLESVSGDVKEKLLDAGYRIKEHGKRGCPSVGTRRITVLLPGRAISWLDKAAGETCLNRSEFLRAVLAGLADSGVSFRGLSERGIRGKVRGCMTRLDGETREKT